MTQRSHRRPPPRARKMVPSAPGPIVTVTIEAVGAQADGIAHHNGEPIYVPFGLPGETVTVQLDGRRNAGSSARLCQLEAEGPDRIAPVCAHFGHCGGCSLQHWAAPAYQHWKRQLLCDAMARVGIAESWIAPLQAVAPGTRRRAALAYRRQGKSILLGFNSRGSHDIIAVSECSVLLPSLVALLPPLRDLLLAVMPDGARGDIVATMTGSGIDLVIEGALRLDLTHRETLSTFANTHDLARLSWRFPDRHEIEPLSARRSPQMTFGGIPVDVPPGGFLQPCAEGEALLVALVRDAVGTAPIVADLFAGSGSFTFPLSSQAVVHAVEGDAAAYRALRAAADRAQRRVTGECRDLARRPLIGTELRPYAAVVFDPPRAGAAAQAAVLAEAGPPTVVAVSCNPATLARDSRILLDGGYRLVRVTPVDQFPWSTHLEAVAHFER